MIIQKEIRSIIKEISEKFNIPAEEVREIVYSQFEYVRKEIEKGESGNFDSYSNILLRNLGTFYASKAKIDHIEEIKRNKKNEECD